MKSSSTLAIPAALVLSSLILAIGWNLGPASSGPAVPVAAAPVGTASASPPSAGPAVTPDPSPRPGPPAFVTPEIHARGVDNARRALEGWRSRFRTQCWDPAVAAAPEPRTISLDFYLSFSPEGELLATGIIEDRRAFRSDVSQCLRGLALDLEIAAPGLPLQVQVPFSLP